MKISLVVFVSCVSLCVCEHLILGNLDSTQKLVHHSVEKYYGIPFTKRIKELFYTNSNQSTIKSIIVYDNLHSQATASVTAGGIGSTYVNIRMKSERGKGLDYDIGIYS